MDTLRCLFFFQQGSSGRYISPLFHRRPSHALPPVVSRQGTRGVGVEGRHERKPLATMLPVKHSDRTKQDAVVRRQVGWILHPKNWGTKTGFVTILRHRALKPAFHPDTHPCDMLTTTREKDRTMGGMGENGKNDTRHKVYK